MNTKVLFSILLCYYVLLIQPAQQEIKVISSMSIMKESRNLFYNDFLMLFPVYHMEHGCALYKAKPAQLDGMYPDN